MNDPDTFLFGAAADSDTRRAVLLFEVAGFGEDGQTEGFKLPTNWDRRSWVLEERAEAIEINGLGLSVWFW